MANTRIVSKPDFVTVINFRQIPVAGYARRDFRQIARRWKLRSANQPLAGFPVPVVDESCSAIEIRKGKSVPPQAEVYCKVGANLPLVLSVNAPVAECFMIASVLLRSVIGQTEQQRSELDSSSSRILRIGRL